MRLRVRAAVDEFRTGAAPVDTAPAIAQVAPHCPDRAPRRRCDTRPRPAAGRGRYLRSSRRTARRPCSNHARAKRDAMPATRASRPRSADRARPTPHRARAAYPDTRRTARAHRAQGRTRGQRARRRVRAQRSRRARSTPPPTNHLLPTYGTGTPRLLVGRARRAGSGRAPLIRLVTRPARAAAWIRRRPQSHRRTGVPDLQRQAPADRPEPRGRSRQAQAAACMREQNRCRVRATERGLPRLCAAASAVAG